MNYELAKQLKDAGFPQNIYLGSDYYDEEKELLRYARKDVAGGNDSPYVKVPTLSELIEACGEGVFDLLRTVDDEWEATKQVRPDGIMLTQGNGSTPEEAVARLWIKLHNA